MNSKNFRAALLVVASMCSPAWCAEPASIADCVGVAEPKSKSRQLDELKTFMVTAAMLEQRGEAKFHVQVEPAASECVFAKFDVGGKPVQAVYTPFEAGDQRTNWRFHVAGDEPRDIIVFYEGYASLVSKKSIFHVAEERNGSLLFYVMFRDPPTYDALRPVVTSIIEGSLKPVVGLRWPPGVKEPLMDGYDTKRWK